MSSRQVASRAATALGLPETTFVRRLRRAQNEAHVARRIPEWTSVTRAIETIVRAPCAGTVRELCTDVKAAVKAQDLLVVLDAKK